MRCNKLLEKNIDKINWKFLCIIKCCTFIGGCDLEINLIEK